MNCRLAFQVTTLMLLVFVSSAADDQIPVRLRSPAAYHPADILDPATLMAQQNFNDTASRGYVVVAGYIDYVAGQIVKSGDATRIKTEDDGDFHFEMQSTNKLRAPGESPNGLVCEIDPVW